MFGYLDRLTGGGDTCPACGEPVVDARTPDGYENAHCGECADRIERRADWLDSREVRDVGR